MMKLLNYILKMLSISLLGLALVSCADTDGPPENIVGTATTGAATRGTVFVIDAKGFVIKETINTNGTYRIDVRKRTAPFMLKTVADNGIDPDLYSYAEEANVIANVTPLTNAALFIANGNADPASLYNNWTSTFVNLTSATINNAQATVNANLSTQYTAYGLDPFTYDSIKTVFAANGTSTDGLLDAIQLDISSGVINLSVTGIGTLLFDTGIDVTAYDIGGDVLVVAGDYSLAVDVSIDGRSSGAFALSINLPASSLPTTTNTQLVEDMFVSFYGTEGDIVINSVAVSGDTLETGVVINATITTIDGPLSYIATYTYTLNQ